MVYYKRREILVNALNTTHNIICPIKLLLIRALKTEQLSDVIANAQARYREDREIGLFISILEMFESVILRQLLYCLTHHL